ncbi:unnamed protein product [Rhodiola kirilowii]
MNTTSHDTGGLLTSHSISGYTYGIGLSIGVILLILTITFASYFCTRIPDPIPRRNRRRSRLDPDHHSNIIVVVVDEAEGLDEETIKSYPKMKFSEAKLKMRNENGSTCSCCSICLADYKKDEMLRLLPDCNHLFHVKCVDPWLRLHPTCPVCRTSPLPTPLSTPLAEVVPLASRRD